MDGQYDNEINDMQSASTDDGEGVGQSLTPSAPGNRRWGFLCIFSIEMLRSGEVVGAGAELDG